MVLSGMEARVDMVIVYRGEKLLHAQRMTPGEAGAIARMNGSTTIGIVGADNSNNCFDLAVLRQTATSELPRSCGGTKPD